MRENIKGQNSLFQKSNIVKNGIFGVLFVLLFGGSACSQPEKPVKFVIASDLHAPDVPYGDKRMQDVVDAANREQVDFLIQLGDFIRMDSVSQPLRKIWDGYKGEKYHVLGNHDLDRYSKEEYVKGFGMPGRYYSFDKGNFHFVVLDGNNIYHDGKYIPYNKANYGAFGRDKIDYMDPEQMEWLKQDLKATNKRCILFIHESIDTELENRKDVQRILEEANEEAGFQKVVLVFSGHNHSNYTKVINGITYMQINSASYVWIGKPTQTEKRYPEAINKKYTLMEYSMSFDKTLFATVTLTEKGAEIKGTQAKFLPPQPSEIGLGDSIGPFPLVSTIEDAYIEFK